MGRPWRGPGSSAIVFLAAVLAGCAGQPRDDLVQNWPRQLPPAAFFIGVYERDEALHDRQSVEQYLRWVVSFYEGTALYPRGWSDLVAGQMAAIEDEAVARERARRLRRLGRDIAAEWAKDNRVRRVDNRLLFVWGEAAGRALDEGNVDETLARISRDLERLMAGELSREAVTPARYHEPPEEDWFAF